MYSPQLIDHFEHPRNAGELPDANARAKLENPACGDVLELTAHVYEGRIEAIRFRAKGCVPAMACGSLIAGLVAGKTMSDAQEITKETIVNAIGGLPEASGHAAQLAVDALRKLLDEARVHG